MKAKDLKDESVVKVKSKDVEHSRILEIEIQGHTEESLSYKEQKVTTQWEGEEPKEQDVYGSTLQIGKELFDNMFEILEVIKEGVDE